MENKLKNIFFHFVKRLQTHLINSIVEYFYFSPLNLKAMYIRNLVKYRRIVTILVGLIVINIITRFVIDINFNDNFSLISYLLVSIIWVDFVRVMTDEIVQYVDDQIRNEY